MVHWDTVLAFVMLMTYRMAQNFDGGKVGEFDEFFAICQNFNIQSFLLQLFACRADAIRQNFTSQFFLNPQFVKVLHYTVQVFGDCD